jgi:hypothetical protein
MLDHTPSTSVAQKMDRLQSFVQSAIEQETEKHRVDEMASKASKAVLGLSITRPTTYIQNSNMPTSFIATEFDQYHEEGNIDLPPSPRIPGGHIVKDMAGLIADMSEEMHNAFQSSAEKALVQASGIRIPIQCWGCKGLHEDCFHSFRNCPRKEDPVIRENFNRNFMQRGFRCTKLASLDGETTLRKNRGFFPALAISRRFSLLASTKIFNSSFCLYHNGNMVSWWMMDWSAALWIILFGSSTTSNGNLNSRASNPSI